MRTPPAARVGPPSRVRVPFVPPLACEYLVAFFRVRVPFSTFSRVRVAYSSPRAQNDVDAAVGVDNARNLSHTKRPRSVFEGLSRQQGKTKVSRRKKKSTKRRQAGRQTGRQADRQTGRQAGRQTAEPRSDENKSAAKGRQVGRSTQFWAPGNFVACCDIMHNIVHHIIYLVYRYSHMYYTSTPRRN